MRDFQKSLPRLEEQIEEKLIQIQRELDRYGNGPPSEPSERLGFLIDVSLMRSSHFLHSQYTAPPNRKCNLFFYLNLLYFRE